MAKPRKVVRTKNLYKKSLLPPKVVGAILFVLLILFIIVVGFVLMHEMTTRFGDDGRGGTTLESSIVAEESSALEEVIPPVVDTTEEIIEEEVVLIEKIAFIDSQTISSGKSAIEDKLDELLKADFDAVAFELKPYTGRLSYNSDVDMAIEYDAIDEDNDLLSLKEIVSLAKEYEVTPVAYMSTLRDQTSAHVQNDNSYAYSTYTTTNWLDNSVSSGGKAWLNPYMENTQVYISDLAEEMYKAGFNTIFLDNVIFPTQNTNMMNTLKTTPSKEQILSDFVEIVQDAVPDATVFRVEDLTNTATIDDYTGSDVNMTNYNTVLSRCENENIAVFMSLDNIANKKGQIILREDLSVDSKADTIDIFTELLEKTISVLDTDITLVIPQKDFDEVTPVLEEFGIVSFIVTN